jgi:tetratricopeptide (TPR) repeat protein
MKLIRRILRYVMLLVFIVAIGCAYYYRSLIFSEMINTYVDGTVNRVLVWANIVPEQADPTTQETREPQEAEGTQEVEGTQKVADCGIQEAVAQATETKVIKCECEIEITNLELVAEAHVDEAQVDEAANDEPVQTETEEQTPEVGAGLTPDTEPEPMVVEEQGFETDVDQAAEWEPVQTETEEQTIETEADQAIDEETEQEQTEEDSGFEAARESSSPNSNSELINQARLLHLTGNSSNAIELYQELAELYPDDPNVVGEMGNVYYLQGDWEQASLAYYEAALRLQKLRMTEQIHYLYLVIHGLDPDVAEKLREQLES